MTSTDFSHVAHAPVSSNVPALRRLSAVLSELNFTFDGMETLLGTEALAAITRDQNVPAKVRTEHLLTSPRASQQHLRLAHCIDFFLLGAPKTEAELNLTFGHDVAPQLPELGLAHHQGQQLRAAVDLRPHAADDGTEIWVASDLAAHQRPGVLHADHVLSAMPPDPWHNLLNVPRAPEPSTSAPAVASKPFTYWHTASTLPPPTSPPEPSPSPVLTCSSTQKHSTSIQKTSKPA